MKHLLNDLRFNRQCSTGRFSIFTHARFNELRHHCGNHGGVIRLPFATVLPFGLVLVDYPLSMRRKDHLLDRCLEILQNFLRFVGWEPMLDQPRRSK